MARPDLLILLQPPALPPLGPPPPRPGASFLSVFILASSGYRLLGPQGPILQAPSPNSTSFQSLGIRTPPFWVPLLRPTSCPYWARALPTQPGPPLSRTWPHLPPYSTISKTRTSRVHLPHAGTLGPRPPDPLGPNIPPSSIASRTRDRQHPPNPRATPTPFSPDSPAPSRLKGSTPPPPPPLPSSRTLPSSSPRSGLGGRSGPRAPQPHDRPRGFPRPPPPPPGSPVPAPPAPAPEPGVPAPSRPPTPHPPRPRPHSADVAGSWDPRPLIGCCGGGEGRGREGGKDAGGRETGLENGGGREGERIETEAERAPRGRGTRRGRETE